MKQRIVSSALCCLLAAAAANATTVVGTGTPASCTEAALNAAIGEANAAFGIVTFDCGPAPHTLVLATGKTLMNGVIVDGGGKITLSGGNATRIFNLPQGAGVVITDIALTRGFDSSGGCILVQGSGAEPAQLTLVRVRFDSCKATLFGGAIAATNATLQLSGSVFLFNEADTGGGGAISLNGGSLLTQADEFTFNTAFDQGGALQVWFASVQIAGGLFFGNASESATTPNAGGGALLLRSSAATVTDTDFVANQALRQGGAIHLQDGADLTVDNSRFENNSASSSGGGVFAGVNTQALLGNSTFIANTSGTLGGALYGAGELHAQASTFYRNRAEAQGSAIYLDNGGSLEVISATLVDNFRFGASVQPAQLAWNTPAVTVHNTLLQSPGQPAPACHGPFGTFSFSIWPDDSCPAASGGGNLPFTLVPLRPPGLSCGGAATELTRTFALPAGSLAIDRGSCRPTDPAFDQRGMPRPQGASCDVGATEFFVPCDGPFFADGFETGNTQRWSQTLP